VQQSSQTLHTDRQLSGPRRATFVLAPTDDLATVTNMPKDNMWTSVYVWRLRVKNRPTLFPGQMS